MAFWIYGRDAKDGRPRDPLFIETDDEVDARRQAEEAGIVVEETELVRSAKSDVLRTSDVRVNGDVILTTTPTVEGRRTLRYLGIVSGAVIVSPGAIAAMTDLTAFVGGRSRLYERELGSARNLALDEIESAALAIAANAIVGVQFQYEMIYSNLMVCVSGTAVIVEGEGGEKASGESTNEYGIRN